MNALIVGVAQAVFWAIGITWDCRVWVFDMRRYIVFLVSILRYCTANFVLYLVLSLFILL